jgi:hypothetical protein
MCWGHSFPIGVRNCRGHSFQEMPEDTAFELPGGKTNIWGNAECRGNSFQSAGGGRGGDTGGRGGDTAFATRPVGYISRRLRPGRFHAAIALANAACQATHRRIMLPQGPERMKREGRSPVAENRH